MGVENEGNRPRHGSPTRGDEIATDRGAPDRQIASHAPASTTAAMHSFMKCTPRTIRLAATNNTINMTVISSAIRALTPRMHGQSHTTTMP